MKKMFLKIADYFKYDFDIWEIVEVIMAIFVIACIGAATAFLICGSVYFIGKM